MTEAEIERRALAIYERLSERRSNKELRERLLRREPAEVANRVTALEHSGLRASLWMPTEADIGPSDTAHVPERIGPFRIIAQIGQGGMGQVWRGERDDGLYEQKVAIKLIHAHLTPLAASRFAEERRILARLEHPGIARLIDGGITGDGIPYFVMEYVEGVPIDEAGADRTLKERIGIFVKAAEAVQFAHSHLVVHADLKPSNILVTGRDWVKLLDFGIARLLDRDDEDGASLHPMTSAFASPARRGGASPAIADDIYALGLILRDLVAADGDRDLLAIAAKASAEDEAERYGSAGALIADLERWRERLPVSARPASLRYRMGRFVSRHRIGVTATAVALLVLAGTSLIATLNYFEAERARAQASARFDDVRGTAHYLLFDLADRLERLPNSLALRTELARVSQHYLDRLAASPGAPVEVRLESAAGLLRLAERQGRPGRPNLGHAEAARASYNKGLQTLAALSGPDADRLRAEMLISRSHLEAQTFSDLPAAERSLAAAERLVRLPAAADLRADHLVALSSLRMTQGRYGEARRIAQAAKTAAGSRDDYRRLVTQAIATELLGDATYYDNDAPGSIPIYRRSVDEWQSIARRWPADPLAIRRLPRARYGLGVTLVDGRAAEAVPILAHASAEAKAISERDPSDAETRRMYLIIEGAHAQSLAAVGRVDEAIRVVSGMIDLRRRYWQAAPHEARRLRDLAINIAMLADIEADAGREASACQRYEEVMQMFDRLRRSDQHIALDEGNAVRLVRERQARHCKK